jgi:hypothetical protein
VCAHPKQQSVNVQCFNISLFIILSRSLFLSHVLLLQLETTRLRAESAEGEVQLLKEQLTGLKEQLDEVIFFSLVIHPYINQLICSISPFLFVNMCPFCKKE